MKKSRDDKAKLRDDWMNRLIVNFGDDEGNETTFNGTVIQALMLMNGNEVNNAIMDKDGPVESALKYGMRKGSPNAVMDELFLATLNRRPTKTEIAKIKDGMKPVLPGFKEKDAAAPWQDLMWALLNSSEFILNH